MDHLLSIVTVSYNQAKFIRQNIESVLKQNYSNVEHLIIDGASTDNTLEILKQYPSLRWVSEPDTGQSNALNKGFRLARGRYIGWLNSDDWYAENIFADVVDALKKYPVVMGGCQRSDAEGNCIELNPNVPRNFFDILKYWVMKSTPDQPSVFFRREVLEEVAYSKGVYLDEELDYCMDVDLWLRIARKFNFECSLDKTIVYFRDHQDSKGCTNMAAAYRETSRIYARHARRLSDNERSLSFVIPAVQDSEQLSNTLEALSQQVMQDFEVLVVDHASTKSRAFKSAIIEYGKKYERTCIRYVVDRTEKANYFSAANIGFNSAKSGIIALIEPGNMPRADFSFQALNLFRIDIFGLALVINDADLINLLQHEQSGVRLFNLSAVLSSQLLPANLVIRKATALELGGFRSTDKTVLAMRELLLRASFKSWQVSIENQLKLDREIPLAAEQIEILKASSDYINAKLFVDLDREFKEDSFAKTRIITGINLELPQELIENSKQLLQQCDL